MLMRERVIGPLHQLAPILLAVGFLAGCAGAPTVDGLRKQNAGWWYLTFHMAWPAEQEPAFYIDTLLAHRIVAPPLSRHRRAIALWRFHRRAARDSDGHRFAFIFYATPATARSVRVDIRRDPLLSALEKAGVVIRTDLEYTLHTPRPDVDDTSDRHWSPELQRAWPHFIMGVSETWLQLVTAAAEQLDPGTERDARALVDIYRQVDARVNETWRREGGHALLHHLNALFGYGPVAVDEFLLQF